ncbi:hypothetical protein HK102_011268, partial [Quaeritorhiza haematococci]
MTGLAERDPGPRAGRRRFRLALRATAAAVALIALALGLYVRTVERRLGRVRLGIKNIIAVDFQVVDEAGMPIPDAEVRAAFLLSDGWDLYEIVEDDVRPRSSRTRDDGWVRIHTMGDYQRLRRRGAFDLFPTTGSPEVVFHAYDGVRIRAAGYEPWTRRLEDLRREAGVRLLVQAQDQGGDGPAPAIRS